MNRTLTLTPTSSHKPQTTLLRHRWPAAQIRPLAKVILAVLENQARWIQLSGDLALGKPEVSEIEITYAPKFGETILGLFGEPKRENLTEEFLEGLVRHGLFDAAESKRGPGNWTMVLGASRVPVRFIACD